MTTRAVIIVFVIALLADLILIGSALSHQYRYATKTLLMPLLILYYVLNVHQPNKLFISGLLMSFLEICFY